MLTAEQPSVKHGHSEVNVLTVGTGQGSSGTAALEAAAVGSGSAACSRENIRSTSESVCVPSCGLRISSVLASVLASAPAAACCVSAATDVK